MLLVLVLLVCAVVLQFEAVLWSSLIDDDIDSDIDDDNDADSADDDDSKQSYALFILSISLLVDVLIGYVFYYLLSVICYYLLLAGSDGNVNNNGKEGFFLPC